MQHTGCNKQQAEEMHKPCAVSCKFYKQEESEDQRHIFRKIGMGANGLTQGGNVAISKPHAVAQAQAGNPERKGEINQAQNPCIKGGDGNGGGKRHAATVTQYFGWSTVWTGCNISGIVPPMKRSFATFLNSWYMRLFTWRQGQLVGTDAFGNSYYRAPNNQRHGRERRWVVYGSRYAVEPEASMVPPEWHGWLHHSYDAPLPVDMNKSWIKPHQANLTGTASAYRPAGHQLAGGKRAAATGDYEAWSPEGSINQP